MEQRSLMPRLPDDDGDHALVFAPAVSSPGPHGEALGDGRTLCGKRAMVIWTALLLGALGGMAGFVSSPHPWQKPANSLEVVHEDDGLFGPARPDQDRTRVRALSRDDGGKWTEYRQDVPAAAAVLPRILTVLTTYGKRSALVKEYKEAVLNRDDGLHPEIFVVSDLYDTDPFGVIDFKVGASQHHRSIAALAEATLRFDGMFDWIALGDDDTAFMYNRAMHFLSHIDHTKPVMLGRVDGLNSTERPAARIECFSEEEKITPTSGLAAHRCCRDVANPCKVPAFPPDTDLRRTDTLSDYGPNSLFWPYGGSGTFISAGLAVDVVGPDGWALCARMFVKMNTDVQIAQCLKMHGYSVGSYPEGFSQVGTSAPGRIQQDLEDNCQVFGVHLGIKHVANHGRKYTPESFGAAVAAVRDADTLSTRDGEDPTSHCHGWWTTLPI